MEREQGYPLVDHETHSVHGSESFPHRNAVQFEWLKAENIGQFRPGAGRGCLSLGPRPHPVGAVCRRQGPT